MPVASIAYKTRSKFTKLPVGKAIIYSCLHDQSSGDNDMGICQASVIT